ncbi:hypothetical protein GCM10027435_07480 [Haloparvum alkalitolerans]|uniref:DUF3311 domain-containing protein n=1 Tax=Haloparvum alkalitolerans TaxID=1042953 RepID=UPI003CF6A990
MADLNRDLVWIPTFAVLIVFAVPWFLWGVDRVVAGLPVWVWWHVGWMCLCAVLFARFAGGAWDRGMTVDFGPTAGADGDGGSGAEAPASGGGRTGDRGGDRPDGGERA